MSASRFFVETELDGGSLGLGLTVTKITRLVDPDPDTDDGTDDPAELLGAITATVARHIDDGTTDGELIDHTTANVLVSRNVLEVVPEAVLSSTLAAQAETWGVDAVTFDTRAYSTLANHRREIERTPGVVSQKA